MSIDDASDTESVLDKHRSLIEKYARKFQIDLHKDDSSIALTDEEPRLSQISASFHKYMSAKQELQRSIEEDLVIQDAAEELKSPEIKGPAKRGSRKVPELKLEKSPVKAEESVDIEEIMKKYKEKKVTESQSSLADVSNSKISVRDSIEDLIMKYKTAGYKKSPPKKLQKSDEDIEKLLERIKSQFSHTRKSSSPEKSSTDSLSKKSTKMPPRVHQLTQDEVQKVLRKSLQSKSIEELYTKKR
eukprot:TRINITY_DN15535_c0_g1_i2.p2 TRINITY_DN15535_c0_g1~~TRINITY_DN15535_c0_g1_i2.p2  ORF type:complete len:244 (-),score=70.01 TRINITY_DN15535_c0_g1_i2:994-1725(-)